MNFDEITSKVKQLGKDTLVEVQKLNDIRVLRGKMNASQKKIRNIYIEIGKKIYEQYKEEALSGFEEEISSITENLAVIEELKQQIREVKGVVVCPCCNTDVPATEAYCPNCGNKMPEIELPEEDFEDDDDAAEEAENAVAEESEVSAQEDTEDSDAEEVAEPEAPSEETVVDETPEEAPKAE